MPTRKIRYTRVSLHFLIWALISVFLLVYPHSFRRDLIFPPEFIWKQIVHLALMLGSFYFNAYYLVPRFLLAKRYIPYYGSVLAFIIGGSLCMYGVSDLLNLNRRMPITDTTTLWHSLHLDRFATWTSLLVWIISGLIAVMGKWKSDSDTLAKLEHEQMQSELATLRAQIHPHFLFNTLHTVYALSYVDSGAARKALAQLSRLLRHQLYAVQNTAISLKEELSFITDYIDIMRLRLSDTINLNLHLPDNIGKQKIAQMILITYIENMFKHGSDSEASQMHIHIYIFKTWKAALTHLKHDRSPIYYR